MIKESIPVYVVTGFLDSGKTSLINSLFATKKIQNKKKCLIQFELGEEDILTENNVDIITFSKKQLESDFKPIVKDIVNYLNNHNIDELWIEWNGITPFDQLQVMFKIVDEVSDERLDDLCHIETVVFITEEMVLMKTLDCIGDPVLTQIENSDLIIIRNCIGKKISSNTKKTLKSFNQGVDILDIKNVKNILFQIYRYKMHPINFVLYGILIIILFLSFGKLWLSSKGIYIDAGINIFLGILLQAIPFLIVGVLLSSAIQIYVSSEFIEKKFPRQLVKGIIFAIIAGLFLPVCDCASIPIFRSLIRKKVPLVSSLVFMTVTPIINPVALFSTYYAFGGNLKVLFARVSLGIIVAVLVGITVSLIGPKDNILLSNISSNACSCGCNIDSGIIASRKQKFLIYLQHAQNEFFNVGKYLVIGAFVSAFFQTVGSKFAIFQHFSSTAESILIMMAMAFFLSLCSTSDAIVGRSLLAQFPMSAVMGFLVFGPMMDVKNMIMLSGSFSKKFIVTLFVAVVIICFVVINLFASSGLGDLLL